MTDLEFTVLDARAAQRSAQPTVIFRVRVRASGEPVEALVLHAGVRVEPQWRAYDAAQEVLLEDLFGTPDRWGTTLRSLNWSEVPVMVKAFDGEGEFEVRVPCTYDFDAAVTRYFSAVADGAIPVRMLFSGSLFRRAPEGFCGEMVPWSCECAYRMPASLWQDAMRACYGDAVLLRIDRATFEALQRLRSTFQTTSWDATLSQLLRCYQ